MVRVNEYISYKIYPKGTKDNVIEEDIHLSGAHDIYPISKPSVRLLNGFIKRIGHLPKDCDFKTQFVVYFIDYNNAPEIPPLDEEDYE